MRIFGVVAPKIRFCMDRLANVCGEWYNQKVKGCFSAPQDGRGVRYFIPSQEGKDFYNIVMKNMGKRIAALVIAALMLILSGCHSLMDDSDSQETKYIAATFYPIYALAVNIMKDVPALSLTCLTQPQDGCLRSYQLSDWDERLLLSQDAVVLGGRGLESFESTLQQLPNQPILLSTLEGLNLREENVGDPDDEQTHFSGENPWTFLSVAGAMEMSIAIAGSMQSIDEAFADRYAENLTEYLDRLEMLVGDMSDIIAPAPRRPVAVLHEGLTYFTAQFSLDMALIYPREPGTDLSGNDMEALFAALKESNIRVVFLEKQAPAHLVNALKDAGYAVARLDTLTNHPADGDFFAYEQIMLENARAAYAALEEAR